MACKEVNVTIINVTRCITDGALSRIQSATDESLKRRLVNRYCGRLATWETSWFSVLQEKRIILEAYEGHWFFPDPASPAFSSTPDNTSGNASDEYCRSVSAIKKVLERCNLVHKRRLH